MNGNVYPNKITNCLQIKDTKFIFHRVLNYVIEKKETANPEKKAKPMHQFIAEKNYTETLSEIYLFLASIRSTLFNIFL